MGLLSGLGAKARKDTHVINYGSLKDGIMISEGHMHGWRETQEDAAVISISIKELPDCNLLALFDGHGGAHISLYAARNIERVFREQLRLQSTLGEALVLPEPTDDVKSAKAKEAAQILEKKKKEYNSQMEEAEEAAKANITKSSRYVEYEIGALDAATAADKAFAAKFANPNLIEKYVTYYQVQQALYGIYNMDDDDTKREEAFKNMLLWEHKYHEYIEKENMEMFHIDAGEAAEFASARGPKMAPEKIRILFENTFKQLDNEIRDTFFTWDETGNLEARAPQPPSADAPLVEDPRSEDEKTRDKARLDAHNEDVDRGLVAPLKYEPGSYILKEEYWESKYLTDEAAQDKIATHMMGCPGTVVLFTPDWVIMANAGDCRTIYGDKLYNIHSTNDHKPTDPVEKWRCEQAGGFVNENYIMNAVGPSRCLGDFMLKSNLDKLWSQQIVTSLPDVTIVDRAKVDFVATGCDGIWDKLTNSDVSNYVGANRGLIGVEGEGPEVDFQEKMSNIVKEICEKALSRLSNDNISFILTFFDADKRYHPSGIRILSRWKNSDVKKWMNTLKYDDKEVGSLVKLNDGVTGIELLNINIDDREEAKKSIRAMSGVESSNEVAEQILNELEKIKQGPLEWDKEWVKAWFEIEIGEYKAGEKDVTPEETKLIDKVQWDGKILMLRPDGKFRVDMKKGFGGRALGEKMNQLKKKLSALKNSEYDWFKLHDKVKANLELEERRAAEAPAPPAEVPPAEAPPAEAPTAEAAAPPAEATPAEATAAEATAAPPPNEGGKKSRRKRTKRRRTPGGKKSRKLRKRRTIKGVKRKRRRTRRRR